jgi:hypothetical protein
VEAFSADGVRPIKRTRPRMRAIRRDFILL